MRASDLFVKTLEQEGVTYMFGLPGEENLMLLDSIRTSSIRFILTRHEQAAGFMAATVGKLTGELATCLSTLGPGATNLMTAVAYSQLGGMPVLFITGQKPVKKSKQGHFQVINTVEMMRPLTKLTKQIIHAQVIPSLIRNCVKLAKEERPGAVHLELPEDVAAEKADDILQYVPIYTRRPVAEKKAVERAIAMIEKAKRPLILVGAGANRKRTSNMLTTFIEKTRIPFFTTQMGKGVVDERSEQYLGTAALSENDYLHCAIDKSDLIINVGHDIIEKPPFIMRPTDKRAVIHINFFPAVLDPIYSPQLEVIGDIANTVWQIEQNITPQKTWDFTYFKRIRKHLLQHIANVPSSYPYSPQQIVEAVRNQQKDDDITVLDNGMFKIWFARNYQTRKENTLLLDNVLATMGAGLPCAIAAKLIKPHRNVIAVTGDGGFMMNAQELETALRLKLHITVLVLKDNAYGMIRWKQENMGLTNFGLDFSNPDFVALAQSFGAQGHRVEKIGDLEKLLDFRARQKTVHVIELPVDYTHNKRVLIDELRKKTCEL